MDKKKGTWYKEGNIVSIEFPDEYGGHKLSIIINPPLRA